MSYVRQGKNVVGLINYVWRSEELQTAVRMFTGAPDLTRLERAKGDIDALAHTITMIPLR